MSLQHRVYPIVLGSVGYLGALHGASICVSYGTHRLIHAAEWDRHRSCWAPNIAVSLVVNLSLRSCTDWTQRNSVWQSAQASFRLSFLRTTVHCGHYGPRALIHHCSLLPVNGRISNVYIIYNTRGPRRETLHYYTPLTNAPIAPSGVSTTSTRQETSCIPPPIPPGPYYCGLESSLGRLKQSVKIEVK